MKVVGILVLLVATALTAGVAHADGDSFTFSTDPGSGSISGAPGSTIGWGYSITNDSSSDWLVILAVTTTADFSNGVADGSIFDFPIIAPGETDSMAFSSVAGTGLYQLTWDPDAPAGAVNLGQFDITGLFCGDASFDGCSDTTVDEFSSYQASVVATITPEPSTILLFVVGLVVLLFGKIVLRRPNRLT
jgi:hypothetical protein